MDSPLLTTLIEAVYDAALDPGRWQGLVRHLERHWSGKAALFSQDTRNIAASVAEGGSFSAAELASYQGHYATTNPWLPIILSRLPAGAVVLDSELVPAGPFEHGEFYNDWLRPQDLYHSIGAFLHKDQSLGTHLTVVRPRRAGAYGPDDIRLMRGLMPHLQRALAIHRRLSRSLVA